MENQHGNVGNLGGNAEFINLLEIINELHKIQKELIWNGNNPKIKHSTLNNTYENGGLKNVDIVSKVISLQHSGIKQLYDN